MKRTYKKQLVKFFILLGLLTVLLSPLYMYFSHDVSKLNELYPHNKAEKTKAPDYELEKGMPKNWAPLKQISAYGKWAIIFSEDWSFYQHEGLDIEQMKVAVNEMLEEKRFRGASTITQQMVKNVFLSQSRSIWRKVHEIVLAQKVEKVLTKQKILEVYLNVIEFGPNVYGIKNASYYYFRKHPSGLSPREAAFLAMLLPSPKKYSVSFRNRKLTRFAQKRVNAILRKLRMGRVIGHAEYEEQLYSKFYWER
jgi:monofunctional biosynthetic peptidoglycan transglycosylase